MSEWIAVKDQLPTEAGTYLICAVEHGLLPRVSIAKYGTHFYMTGRMAYWEVTHWMPLPNPPEDVSNYLLR